MNLNRESVASVNQDTYLKVSALMARYGLGFVCAMCHRMWEAEKAGKSKCGAQFCGGPMGGNTFDQYQGMLSEFWHFCFVCGAPSSHGIRVHGRSRVIGVCKAHLSMLDSYVPEFDLSVNPLDHLEILK